MNANLAVAAALSRSSPVRVDLPTVIRGILILAMLWFGAAAHAVADPAEHGPACTCLTTMLAP